MCFVGAGVNKLIRLDARKTTLRASGLYLLYFLCLKKMAGSGDHLPAREKRRSSAIRLRDVRGLGTFGALHNLKLDWISFL